MDKYGQLIRKLHEEGYLILFDEAAKLLEGSSVDDARAKFVKQHPERCFANNQQHIPRPQAHTTRDKFLNKKIEMSSDSGQVCATGSITKSLFDVDLESKSQNDVHVDGK